MKAVLISIQPKWCELIASGKKTVEVRKTAPKLQTPFKCYIYCTKSKEVMFNVFLNEPNREVEYLSGKVIGEFVCDRIYKYEYHNQLPYDKYNLPQSVLKDMCLICHDVDKYGTNKPLYGWHIFDLKIYEKPKGLGEFRKPTLPTGLRYENDNLTRPPQSWCYVEELKQEE